MGGVHHFLAAEIPDVERHFFGRVERTRPVADLDAFGGLFPLVEFASNESLDQRSLTDVATSHENQFGFVQRLGARTLCEIVGEDFLGGLAGFFFATEGFTECWTEHFGWNAQARVPVEKKVGQVLKGGEGVRNGGDLVVGEAETPQLRELGEGVRNGGDLVAGEVESPQLRKPCEGVRNDLDLVVVEIEALQLRALSEGIRNGVDLVVVELQILQLRKSGERVRNGGDTVVVELEGLQ